MRFFAIPLLVLSACADWNRGPTLEDLVAEFKTAEGIEDAEDCGSVAPRECDPDEEGAGDANQCFADALEACTPAVLEIVNETGDGDQTIEVLVIHPEGEGECAVQRFVSYPEGGRRLLKEESCEGANVPPDVCEAPSADSCVEMCDQGGDVDCG